MANLNRPDNDDGATEDETADDGVFEKIESEEEDKESSPSRYEINVSPADFTLEILDGKMKSKELKIPDFQRSYVWKLKQASRLIESFLLGLPVPPIFLYVDDDEKLLVVDGQQRLKTIHYFFEGFFGEAVGGKRPIFTLTGLNENSPYLGKSYKDLKESNEPAERKFRNTVLRAVIIKQLNPNDNTSIYHIFERLNTGGTPLTGQEIRNCIYHGPFNDLLHQLNKVPAWRSIFGKDAEDKRQRDIEMILRVLALHYSHDKYERPMKDFLSNFMSRHKNDKPDKLEEYHRIFTRTAKNISDSLGGKPFSLGAGLNAALFDAVFTAFARHTQVPDGIKRKYKSLVKKPEFRRLVTATTTDEGFVKARLRMAHSNLFGR